MSSLSSNTGSSQLRIPLYIEADTAVETADSPPSPRKRGRKPKGRERQLTGRHNKPTVRALAAVKEVHPRASLNDALASLTGRGGLLFEVEKKDPEIGQLLYTLLKPARQGEESALAWLRYSLRHAVEHYHSGEAPPDELHLADDELGSEDQLQEHNQLSTQEVPPQAPTEDHEPSPGELAARALWEDVTPSIKKRVSEANWNIWLASVRATNLEAGLLTLAVPNSFFQEYLTEHYREVLKEEISRKARTETRVAFTDTSKQRKEEPPSSPRPEEKPVPPPPPKAPAPLPKAPEEETRAWLDRHLRAVFHLESWKGQAEYLTLLRMFYQEDLSRRGLKASVDPAFLAKVAELLQGATEQEGQRKPTPTSPSPWAPGKDGELAGRVEKDTLPAGKAVQDRAITLERRCLKCRARDKAGIARRAGTDYASWVIRCAHCQGFVKNATDKELFGSSSLPKKTPGKDGKG